MGSFAVKRSIIAVVGLLAAFAPRVGAAEVDVAIRFYDKRVYYAGGDANPVLIQLTVTNRSPATYYFKLADERAFSVGFDVRTMANRPLEPAEILNRKRAQDQPVFFRDVALAPGESLSFTEDLRAYVDLSTAGAYVIQALLYPGLYRPAGAPSLPGGSAAAVASNRLSLTLAPAPLIDAAGAPIAVDVETGAVLVRRDIPPDQVVEYLLSARQKGQWEKFFLYLDLEAMLTRDAARGRAYAAESEEGRQRLVERYRSDLRSAFVDNDIATIPIEFAVERTSYSAEDGNVVVLEKFRYGNYIEKKRYTYYLSRRDDVWTIRDYTVVNLGTE
jgi:hypothetical protein